jgi:hypothetical protein
LEKRVPFHPGRDVTSSAAGAVFPNLGNRRDIIANKII